jgi:hypothetical protein
MNVWAKPLEKPFGVDMVKPMDLIGPHYESLPLVWPKYNVALKHYVITPSK